MSKIVLIGAAGAVVITTAGAAAAAAIKGLTRRVYHRERLDGADPLIARMIDAWDQADDAFPIVIVRGGTTDAEQGGFYAQGRTAPGRIVTYARTATETAHGFRLRNGVLRFQGADVAPYERNALGLAAPAYLDNMTTEEDRERVAAKTARLGAFGESFGLVWGGRWTGLVDRPHFETPDWRRLPVVGGVS